MSLAVRIPRAEGARRWREYRIERAKLARRKHENRVKGTGLVLRLDDGRKLEFRGRHYGVPPVPWRLAPQIIDAQAAFDELEDANPTKSEWEAVHKEVARLFKKVCKPASFLRRIFWAFIPSPLSSASHWEVGQALDFFSTFRKLDGGESLEKVVADLRLRETSRSKSPGSPLTAPHGATNGGAP